MPVKRGVIARSSQKILKQAKVTMELVRVFIELRSSSN